MKSTYSDFSAIRAAFSNRNFTIYAAGNSVSLIGLWVQRLAVGWFAWELTGSGLWLGAVAFADLFPVVVIGPFAGVLADRLDRRLILLACQTLALAQAGVLFALTVLDFVSIEILFGLTLLLGVVIAVHQPARLSLVPSLVRPDDLASAVAISSVIFNLARFVGPAVAGVIITSVGIAPAFAFNGATYLVMIVALACIRLSPQETPPWQVVGVVAEVREGLRYAFSHPAIAPLLILLIAATILARPVFELLPGFADAVFNRGAGGLATLTSAAGLGAITGGMWLAQRGTVAGLTNIALGGVILSGLMVVVFAGTSIFWIAVPAMTAAGFAMVVFGVGTQTLIQTTVEVHMRGRVLSLWGLIFRGGPALGALAMGWLSGFFGLRWPLAVGGVMCVMASLLALRWRTRLVALLEENSTSQSFSS